jgi:hypothetical protein
MIAPGGFTTPPPGRCFLEPGDGFAADCEFAAAEDVPRRGDRVLIRPLTSSAVVDRPVIADVLGFTVLKDVRDEVGNLVKRLVRLECEFVAVAPAAS